MYYENKYKDQDTDEAKTARAQIETIKKNRQWGQPYVRLVPVPAAHASDWSPQLAWYAFSLCMLVLFTNGWYADAVFAVSEQ